MTAHEHLWERIAPIHRQILELPFVTELRAGTLDRRAFVRYLLQDGIFLGDYARALALCAARSPELETLEMFCRDATEAIATERSMHERLLTAFEVDPSIAETVPPSPTCLAYTSYLLRVAALGERHEALGAILPCYWVYWEVGRALAEHGSASEVYSEWIRTYADPAFEQAVTGCIGAYDAGLEGLPSAARERAEAHALQAARYELMFWKSAYDNEHWPV